MNNASTEKSKYLKAHGAVPAQFTNVNLEPQFSNVNLKRQFKFVNATELAKQLPMKWLVRNVLPARGVACLFGTTGSGKTFLVLDLIAKVAAGNNWFNHKTHKCPIVYLALEGEHGVGQRVRALRKHSRASLTDVHFVTQDFSLLKEGDVNAFITDMQQAGVGNGLLVIDTLNRASPEADENSSRDMGRILAAVKRIQQSVGGLVLLVHHTGKDGTKGMRGHSSLLAALDAAIEVKRTANGLISWVLTKSKDGRDGAKNVFSLKGVELGSDEEGEMLTSCIVVQALMAQVTPAIKTEEQSQLLVPRGKNQQRAFDAIKQNQSTLAIQRMENGEYQMRKDCVLDVVAISLDVKDGVKVQRAKETIKGMVERGILRAEGDHLYLQS